MKVLLCEDVESLGWYGDVVEVKEGYARNYLLPQRVAVVPSESKIKAMAEEKAKRSEQRNIALERLKKIAENLRQQGFEIADKFVRLDHHIKEAGEFSVRIKFAADITATVKVTVVPEGQIAEAADDSTEQTNAE